MKNLIFVLSAFTLLLGTVSCDPTAQYSKELKEIDSCLAVIDTIEKHYYEIHFDSLNKLVEHIKQNESEVKKYYISDTINQQLAKNLNRCKGVRKYFVDVPAQQINYHEEIEAIKTQFINLKTDIENGVLKKEQIDKYMLTERSDLGLLNKSFSAFYEKQKKAFQINAESVPFVDEFIREMKEKANDTIPE